MNEKQQDANATPISDLTPAQVRRELAERLGYFVATEMIDGDEWYILVKPDGGEFGETRNESYFYERVLYECLPDWPSDPGSALALCLEIAARNRWYVTISDLSELGEDIVEGEPIMVRFYTYGGAHIGDEQHGATPAEALARLALAALRGGAR